MSGLRILFASCHGYLDRSSGAAAATRDLMELLACRGNNCRVLTTGVLDYRSETPLETMLAGLEGAISPGEGGGGSLDLEVGGVRITLLPTGSSRIERSPDPTESMKLLDLTGRLFERFRPHVLLTYGGHPANLEMMTRARQRGIAVVFHLHNLAYTHRRVFADADAVVVGSRFAQRHYQRLYGQPSTVIPNAVRFDRVVATEPLPHFLTFVNPERLKGAAVFAQIAAELSRRRPDVPLLVVEGRATTAELGEMGVNLRRVGNLERMTNTADPRQFYGVSRVVVVPSLVRETFGRVAAEAMTNGLPVLASDRGALPETLGNAGFVLALPSRCLDGSAPTAHEVAPWVATIERLWDDSSWEADHRGRARAEAVRWNEADVVDAHEALFWSLRHGA